MNNKIIKFVNGDLQLDVTVSPDNETVWLNRNQLAQLFDRDVKTIGKHINNALKEELVNMVKEVNTEGVAADEVLSDHVYEYNRTERLITM